MRATTLSLLLILVLVSSCRVGPGYQPPVLQAPAEWKAVVAEVEEYPEVDNWWEVFQDEKLTELEELAVLNNPELQLALERVAEARAVAGVARADLFPQL